MRQFNTYSCRLGHLAWAVMHAAFDLPKPGSYLHGRWLMVVTDEFKFLVLLGEEATCWSVWLTRIAFTFKTNKLLFCRLFS